MMMRSTPDNELRAILEALRDAYASEKRAALTTTQVIERARAQGISFKVLALSVTEHLPAMANENVIDRAERLEVALRQRVAQHRRRRGVIADHARFVARVGQAPAVSVAEVKTMNPGKPTYVRETFYDGNLPPDAPVCPVFDDDMPASLGEAAPTLPRDHDCDDEEP